MTFRLQELPPEIQLSVAEHLSAREFLRLAATCRPLHKLLVSDNDQEWTWRAGHEFRCSAPCEKSSERHPSWIELCESAMRGESLCLCLIPRAGQCEASAARNERHGKVLKGWIKPEDIDVWRIKVDEGRRMLFASSREGASLGGLLPLRDAVLTLMMRCAPEEEPHIAVFDLDTRERLQTIEGVGLYSHLELGQDHLVASHMGSKWTSQG